MWLRSVPAFLLVILSASFALCQTTAVDEQTADVPDRALNQNGVQRYHDHGIRDIDAIGTRNVGCNRGLGNWYSLERQIAMGRDYSAQVESTAKMIRDPQVKQTVGALYRRAWD